MNPGNNPNNSSLRPRVPFLVTPEQYLENIRWKQQHEEMFNQLNRQGLETYLRVQSDLDRRIAEGELAKKQKQLLDQLTSARAIAAPPITGNRAAPLPYTGPTYVANSQPAVNFVNGIDAFLTNEPNISIANSTPLNVPLSSSQQPTLPAQTSGNSAYGSQQSTPPFSSSASAYSTTTFVQQQQNRHPQGPPISIANPNTVPLQTYQSAAGGQSQNVSRSLYSQQQQQSNTATVTGPQASSPRAQGAQIHSYAPWSISYQAPTAGPSSSGSGQEVSGAGLSHRASYSTSSSSLAGALGEKVNIQVHGSSTNVQTPIKRAASLVTTAPVENQGRANSGVSTRPVQMPSASTSIPVSQVSPSHGAAQSQNRTTSLPATLSAMSDEQFKQEQALHLRNLLKRSQGRINASSGSSSFKAQNNFVGAHGQAYRNETSAFPSVRGWSPPAVSTHEQNTTSAVSAPYNVQQDQHMASNINVSFRDASSTADSYVPATSNINQTSSAGSAYAAPSASQQSNYPNTGFNVATRGPIIDLLCSPDISAVRPPPPPSAQASQEVPDVSGRYPTSGFATPPPGKNRPSAPVTPASANKKTLAMDVLRALNKQPEKRKALPSESSGSDADRGPPPLKKQAIEPLPADYSVMIKDVFSAPSVLPVATDISDTARIEEVNETVADSVEVIEMSTPPPNNDVTEVVPRTSMASDIPNVPDSLPPGSAIESRASSEAGLDMDDALQPYEDSALPLFLPSPDSPPNSPQLHSREVRQGMDEISSLARSEELRRKYKHSLEVFVEVPILTPAQRRLFLKQTTGMEAKGFKDPSSGLRPHLQSEAAADPVANVQVVDEDRRRSAQEAANIASSRLRKRPCLWNDCHHLANSGNSLMSHVWEHVDWTPNKDKIFPCWWGDCIRRFNKREALCQHLQNHVKKSEFCAYEDCDAQFAHPLELLGHVESKHPSGSKLRPSTKPFVPNLRPLQPLGTMFAYQVINLPVEMAKTSEERRAKLGPWVAQNCFGSVNLGVPKLNVRNQPQRRRPGDGLKLLGDWQDRYDFVEPWGSTYPQRCADLESSKATEEIEAGLLLVPDVGGPRGPLAEQLLTSRADRIKLSDSQNYEIKPEHDPEQLAAEFSTIKVEDLSADLSQVPLSPSSSQGPRQEDFLAVGDLQLVGPDPT